MGRIPLGKVKGEDGKSVFIKYNTINSDAGAQDSPFEGAKYIGIKTGDEPYKWTQFVGDNGMNGTPGLPGTDGKDGQSGEDGIDGKNGKNCYIKFSMSANIAGATDNWQPGQKWVGFAVSSEDTAPLDNAGYRWSKFGVDNNEILELVYPVGSIYESTTSVSPASFIGGTWASFGEGRVLVGVGTSDVSYTIGKTGGASTVVLESGQIPDHWHALFIPDGTTASIPRDFTALLEPSFVMETNRKIYNRVNTGDVQGSTGKSHENMPPYIVVYRYRRIA